MNRRLSIGAAAILGISGAAALGGCDVVAGIGAYCTEGKDPGCGGTGGSTGTTTGGTTTTGGGGATSTGGTGGATQTGGGGTGGMLECSPVGATETCYNGPDDTANIGVCRSGMHQCMSTNMWGQCMNEVLPTAEDCSKPDDEDCNFGTGCSETVWSKIAGDASNQYVQDVAYDSKGNLYVVGQHSGTLDFGNEPLISSSVDVFVAKLDPLGNRLWSRKYGDTAAQIAYSVVVDGSDNVIVAGVFAGEMDVDGTLLSAVQGGNDAFVFKLAGDGSKLWARRFGDAAPQQAVRSVAVDKSTGDIVIAGTFEGTLNFDGQMITATGQTDAFLAKLSQDGMGIWAKHFGDGLPQLGAEVSVDPSGNIFMSGQFQGAVDFGAGYSFASGSGDIFLARFGANGATSWAKRMEAVANAQPGGLASDADGNVIMGIESNSNIDAGGGTISVAGYDVILTKFSSGGTHLWQNQISGVGDEYGPVVGVDGNKRIVLSFYTSGDVNPGAGNLPSGGGMDIVVAGVEPTGTLRWAKRYGTVGDQSSPCVALGPKGQIAIGAYNTGTVNFGPENLMSAGGTDIAIAEIGPN